MLQTILNILWCLLIVLAVLSVGLWIYRMITQKEFRDAEFENARKAQREQERRKRMKQPYWTERQYKRYLRTGNRHHLVYDYDDEEEADDK
mgnify:CR=1 FL=1